MGCYEPYQANLENLIGRKVDSIELFPASEGFLPTKIPKEKGMLLLLNSGIFYEFIRSDAFYSENQDGIPLAKLKQHYEKGA
jgi:hypothetical protein